ncbi:hypothetical protein J7643_05965 [bacterium]|nr:hypothetical protein [bacterium]
MSQEKTLEQLQAELVTALMQDDALKAEFIANPNAVASRVLGIQIPSFIKLMPVEIPANAILVPLPAKMGEDELSDLDLELVAGGKSQAEQQFVQGFTNVVQSCVTMFGNFFYSTFTPNSYPAQNLQKQAEAAQKGR